MLKPQKLKATYSIEITPDLYEEIRINEAWDRNGKAAYSDKFEDELIWSELYGQSNKDPFDKWAFNYNMCFKGGTGTLESFFENHFSQKEIRRKGLNFLYPCDDFCGSKEDYVKKDPRISWLYYKRSFDAVFPVFCEHDKTHLHMELEGVLEDGRKLNFLYTTKKDGRILVDDEHLLDVNFFNERYLNKEGTIEPLDIGRPEKRKNEKTAVMIYGVHSFTELLCGLEMAAEKALFYEKHIGGDGKTRVYQVSSFLGIIEAKRTDLMEDDLIAMGAKKLTQPEVDERRIGLFYWNYDKSVKTLGGYAEQASYPDMYCIKREAENADGDEYYLVLDELQDLEGWYPLDRFIWEDDKEPKNDCDLRKIIRNSSGI